MRVFRGGCVQILFPLPRIPQHPGPLDLLDRTEHAHLDRPLRHLTGLSRPTRKCIDSDSLALLSHREEYRRTISASADPGNGRFSDGQSTSVPPGRNEHHRSPFSQPRACLCLNTHGERRCTADERGESAGCSAQASGWHTVLPLDGQLLS